MRHNRRVRRSLRIHLAVSTISLSWLCGCADSSGPPPPPEDSAILSNPAQGAERGSLAPRRSMPGTAFSVAPQTIGQETAVTYVSIESGMYPEGRLVRIHSPRLTGTVTATMVEGGLDPVPVPAFVGDALDLEILGASGLTLATVRSKVPEKRRPRVVRTIPPRGKTDIAVNANIVIVFSEPISESSLSSSAVQLFSGDTPISGTTGLLQGVTAAVAFDPSEVLQPNASYRLVVGQEIRDLDGEALEQETSVEFETGSSSAPDVRFVSIWPDMVLLHTGSRLQFIAEAFGLVESTSTMVPIAGVPFAWSSNDPTVANVSSTGMVTGVSSGLAEIRANVVGNPAVSGSSTVQISSSAASVASLEIVPSADTTPVSGKIELRATTRSSTGEVLLFRPVAWRTSSTAIATVEATAEGRAWVTGVSSGRISIIAMSEATSDTSTIDVVDPGPYLGLTAGRHTTCGLRTVGWAFCWGQNSDGELGDGTSTASALPRGVSRGLRFVQMSTGGKNTCGVDIEGKAFCWGENTLGALGIGNTTRRDACPGVCSLTPVAVVGDHRFTEVHVSDVPSNVLWSPFPSAFVCGLTTEGAVYCWGDNWFGQLGVGSRTLAQHCRVDMETCSSVPVAVIGTRSYVSVTTGEWHACALTQSGNAYCWGNNSYGQLGDGTAFPRLGPVPVAGGRTFVALTAGTTHTCGLTSDGAAYCWGSNVSGELGHGVPTGSTTPVRVSSDLAWKAISGGERHTCALTTGGAAYCWGWNEQGALGDGSTANAGTPVAVHGGLIFSAVSAGGLHSCGVTMLGIAYCWGGNASYALGTNDSSGSLVPVRVHGQP
jgi:alpha-tubulin suppressor-like RCC1 family protein